MRIVDRLRPHGYAPGIGGRAAVAAALDTPRGQPMAAARNEQRRKELLADPERLVKSHRSQGIDACSTWREIGNRAVRQ